MSKILIVGPFSTKGGMSRYAHDALKGIKKHEMIRYDTSHKDKSKTTFSKPGYSNIFNSNSSRLVFGLFQMIKNILYFPLKINHNNPDIVHICGGSYSRFWERSIYILISKIMGKKIFLHYLGAFDIFYTKSSRLTKYLIRLILSNVNTLGVLSFRVSNIVKKEIKDINVKILPSSVDTNSIEIFKKKKTNNFSVLFLGGNDPLRKGLEDLIKIIPDIVRNNSSVNFFLSGNKTVKSFMDQLPKEVIGNTNYLGWIPEDMKFNLLQKMDAFILPSYNEGLPYAVIEAMACGLPILAYDVGGISEVVQNEVNGFIVEINDYQSLKKKTISLSSDKVLVENIYKENISKVNEHYSLDKILNLITKEYNELAEK